MVLKFNLNRDVRVSLTQSGFQSACNAGFQVIASNIDAYGLCTFQLWQLIEIFGKTDIDIDDLIQPFEILIESDDLKADNKDLDLSQAVKGDN